MNRHERRAAKAATKRAKASLPTGIKLTRREIETRLQDAILRNEPVLVERFLSALIAEGGTLYEDLPALLKDAILRTLKAAEIAGMRALLVHALDQQAADFYHHGGFLVSPIDPLVLILPLATARRALE